MVRIDFVISRVLAVVIPLGLLAYGLDELGAERTFDQQRQLENAGQVLNGEVLKGPVNDAIHKKMLTNPKVVIIGNSFANTNVQIAMLGRQLGLETGSVMRLSIPNTIGAHWYALLKHRVFRDDYEDPDVVILLSDLQSALLTQPLSEGSYGNLFTLVDGRDPVIADKVPEPSSFWWSTVEANRDKARRNAVLAVRDFASRRVLGDLPRRKLRNQTTDMMDRVFHPAKSDLRLRTRALPVTVGAEAIGIDMGALPAAEDSFLPAIAKLCHERGARFVMVRNKESSRMPPGQGDRVPPGTMDAVRAAIGPWGGELLHMDPIVMQDALYDNLDHMTGEGSKRFTLAIAEALADLGTVDEAERYVRPETPAEVSVPDGDPSSIAAIRRSWFDLPAGRTARWAWDEAWPGQPDTFRVRAVVEPLSDGAPPRLVAGGLVGEAQRMASGRWQLQVEGPAPRGPWEITLQGSVDAVVEGLEVGTGSAPLYLAGYRPDVRGHRLELLGRIEVFDGELYREAVTPRFHRKAPTLPRLRKLNRGPGPSVWVDAEPLAGLADGATRLKTPLRARCSPIRISENQDWLPMPNVGCKEVRELGLGRMCHTEKRIYFSATDDTQPLRNGRVYRGALAPNRACDGGFWLYPEDRTSLEVPPERLAELRDGVEGLTLDLGVVLNRGAPLEIAIRVEVGGEALVTRVVEQWEMANPIALSLPRRVRPDEPVTIVFDNPQDAYSLVNRVTLEPPPLIWETL